MHADETDNNFCVAVSHRAAVGELRNCPIRGNSVNKDELLQGRRVSHYLQYLSTILGFRDTIRWYRLTLVPCEKELRSLIRQPAVRGSNNCGAVCPLFAYAVSTTLHDLDWVICYILASGLFS